MAGIKGRSGRRKMPGAMALLQSSAVADADLQADQCAPEMPEYLTPSAQKHWPRALKQLERIGAASSLDELALACYCEQFAIWRDALAKLKKGSMIVKTNKTGMERASPYIEIAGRAHDRIVKLMSEFGITRKSGATIKRVGSKIPHGKTMQNRFTLIKNIGSGR